MHVSSNLLQSTLSGILLASISLIPVQAQSKPASTATAKPDDKDPVLRVQVRRVPVDVIVLDKHGDPVRGLKKDDFVVKEDNAAQHVLTFDSFDGSVPTFKPPKTPPLPANTYVNLPSSPERGPLYILYYDMVNTPESDQASFHSELLRFIDQAQPGTRIALFVNARGLHLLQGFTSDHALLREAALRKGPGAHIPDQFTEGNLYGRYDAGAALSNLNFISEYLSGIPERKNLIWLSTYFPIPVGPTVIVGGEAVSTYRARQYQQGSGNGIATVGPGNMASQPPVPGSVGAGGGPYVLDLSELMRDSIKHAYAAMMRSQIALYPVSLEGISNDRYPGDVVVDHQNMDTIAGTTGGHAYYGSNREESLIARAVEHGENYYTLTYSPSNTKYDGSERNIQVALAKKKCDCTLTYRTVYYAVSDDEVQATHNDDPRQKRFLATKAEDTLYASIEHGAPMMHDLLFSAHLRAIGSPQMATAQQMTQLQDAPAYFRTRRRNQAPKPLAPVKLQKYVIDYNVIDPQLKALASKANKPSVLEFAAAAYDNDGRLMNSLLNEGMLSTDHHQSGRPESLFRATQELDVPAGAQFIRLAVRNTINNRTGTLEVRLPLKPETETAQARPGSSPPQ